MSEQVARLEAEVADLQRKLRYAWEGEAAALRERDAYKRAKAENDERFMCERDEARRHMMEARRERDVAIERAEHADRERDDLLGAVSAFLPRSDGGDIRWLQAAGRGATAHGALSWAVEACAQVLRRELSMQPPEKRNRITVSMDFGDEAWSLTLACGDYEHAMERQRDEARAARWSAEECRRATREGGRGACEARLRERGADAGAALAAAQEQGARWALAAATNALRAGYEAAERANGCGDPSYYAGVEDAALSALEQVDALDAAEVCRQARGGDDA